MTVTQADLSAMLDVLDELCEAADSLEVEEAAVLYRELDALLLATKRTMSMVDTQLKSTLESPREIDGKLYFKKKTGKWRHAHDMVAAKVCETSIKDPETGRPLAAKAAVQRAVRKMVDLYVSPSKEPTKHGLQSIGLKRDDVARWEITGSEIVVEDVG